MHVFAWGGVVIMKLEDVHLQDTELTVQFGESTNLPQTFIPGRVIVEVDMCNVYLDVSETERIKFTNSDLLYGYGDRGSGALEMCQGFGCYRADAGGTNQYLNFMEIDIRNSYWMDYPIIIEVLIRERSIPITLSVRFQHVENGIDANLEAFRYIGVYSDTEFYITNKQRGVWSLWYKHLREDDDLYISRISTCYPVLGNVSYDNGDGKYMMKNNIIPCNGYATSLQDALLATKQELS